MINTTFDSRLTKRLSRVIALSFAVMIGSMTVFVALSVSYMQQQQEKIAEIVQIRNKKIQLATNLVSATHNRHNSLVYQSLVADPFEQDAHFAQYNRWGYEVGNTRNQLRAMPLDDFEMSNLHAQDILVSNIIELHEMISDLARQGDLSVAREKIATVLRPFNINFIDLVSQLEQHERDLIQVALSETQTESKQAIIADSFLGLSLIVMAIIIAIIMHHQLNYYGLIIDKQVETLKETGIQLEHKAHHDPLTGLPNRTLFYKKLADSLGYAREHQIKLTVFFVDLDNFKQINDSYGHGIGDKILQMVAHILWAAVRSSDTVARLGGDEFAIILLGLADDDPINRIKSKIYSNMKNSLQFEGVLLTSSCSCGHAIYPDDGETVEDLLKTADTRMYAIKNERKNSAS